MIAFILALSPVFRYKSYGVCLKKKMLSSYPFHKEESGVFMIVKVLFQFCERLVIFLSFPGLDLCCQYHNMILQENALGYF